VTVVGQDRLENVSLKDSEGQAKARDVCGVKTSRINGKGLAIQEFLSESFYKKSKL
jgi:hypothetical protein